MWKTIFKCIIVALLLNANIHAQSNNVQVTYEVFHKVDLKKYIKGERKLSIKQQKDFDNLMRSFSKTFVLNIKGFESNYKEHVKLGYRPENIGSGNTRKNIEKSFTGESGLEYKNASTKLYVKEDEFLGKRFLIKEQLKLFKWSMTNEKKQIGKYLCKKATTTIKVNELEAKRLRIDMKKFHSQAKINNDQEKKVPLLEVHVTAWYTPEIAIPSGPTKYWGLPGLILEIIEGNTTTVYNKITFDSDIVIKIPRKGKKVSKEEYNYIITKKLNDRRR